MQVRPCNLEPPVRKSQQSIECGGQRITKSWYRIGELIRNTFGESLRRYIAARCLAKMRRLYERPKPCEYVAHRRFVWLLCELCLRIFAHECSMAASPVSIMTFFSATRRTIVRPEAARPAGSNYDAVADLEKLLRVP